MKKKRTKKVPFHEHLSFWRILVVILIIIILLLVFPRSAGESEKIVLSKELIEARITVFLQKTMQPGTSITIHKVVDVGQAYSLDVTVGNESATIYASKDGKYFFPGAIDMRQTIPVPNDVTGSAERVEVSADDDAVLGNDDASVTIIEFSDYQCPMCGKFWAQTLPKLKKDYIDTGKVKFVFRDFPLSYHPYAQKAAEASECARDQGMFWEYHDKLFENSQTLSTESFTLFAVELGLDVAQFTDCFNSGKYESEVKNDFADGMASGIKGTPAFFINGIPVSGALSFESFKEIIDDELGYS